MESNAAGQVGGLDVSEEARRRYARESRGWKCEVCGVTNEETMGECARRWEEAREKGLVREGGNEVPEELRLAYKEDLAGGEKEKGEESGSAPGILDEVTTSPVQTRTDEGASAGTGQDTTSGMVTTRTQHQPAAASPRTAGPASSIAQATSSASTNTAPVPTRTITPTQVVSPDDGVPAWVDKAIFGVLLSLVLMILKRMIA